jgi:hypothetical protein
MLQLFSELISFFLQKAVFWIFVMRAGSYFANNFRGLSVKGNNLWACVCLCKVCLLFCFNTFFSCFWCLPLLETMALSYLVVQMAWQTAFHKLHPTASVSLLSTPYFLDTTKIGWSDQDEWISHQVCTELKKDTLNNSTLPLHFKLYSMHILMHKTYVLSGIFTAGFVSRHSVLGNGPYMCLVNYEYVSLSPLILGISHVWLLVPLSVAHTWSQNLKVYLELWTLNSMSCCDIFLIETVL